MRHLAMKALCFSFSSILVESSSVKAMVSRTFQSNLGPDDLVVSQVCTASIHQALKTCKGIIHQILFVLRAPKQERLHGCRPDAELRG